MDDDFDDDDSDTFVNYALDLTLCRLIGKLMIPSRLKLKLGIEIMAEDDDELEFALNKVKHWMDNTVSRAIAVSSMNAQGFGMLLDGENKPRLENPLMITPLEPSDHHLMFIFQAKIRALSDGVLDVMTIEVTSNDAQGISFTYIGSGEGELPDMKDWIPGPNWFTEPWWARNDVSMIDTVAPEGTDLTVRPAWAGSLDFLRPESGEQTAIIVNGDWEPKIIEGDKKK